MSTLTRSRDEDPLQSPEREVRRRLNPDAGVGAELSPRPRSPAHETASGLREIIKTALAHLTAGKS